MEMQRMRSRPALPALVGALLAAPTASAGEIQVGMGPGVYGSSWHGDSSVGHALRLFALYVASKSQ